MRLAVWQGASGAHDAFAIAARVAAEAAGAGAAMVVLPEMFLSGYAIGRAEAERLAEPGDGPAAARIGAIARRHGIALVYGFPERDEDGRVFNAAQIVGANGTVLLRARKTHLFGALDREMVSAGDSLSDVVTIGDLRVGLMICYDVEFPETVRALALRGADLIVVPTALMQPYTRIATLLAPARAFESQVFVAYANRIGTEGTLDYCGLSCIAGPDGRDLARAGAEEALLVADLDAAALAASRREFTYLVDRRASLYAAG